MIPHEQLELCAQKHGDCTAVVCGRKTLTYGELRARARAVAAGLAAHGIGSGDVGLILLGNSIEFAICYFACSYLGALFMPLDPRLAAAEVARLCAIGEPTFLIAAAKSAETVGPALESSARWSVVATVGEQELPGWDILQFMFDEAEHAFADIEPVHADIHAEDPVALLATSGTTGQPKLATLPARAWDLFLYALEKCWGVKPGSAEVLPVPMSHISGPIFLNACVYFPMKLVIMKRYSPRRLLDLVREHEPVFCNITPSMSRVLLDGLSPEQLHEIGSTSNIAVFGAPMPQSLLDEFHEKIGVPPQSGYGLTEAVPLTCLTPLAVGVHEPGSLGKPVPMPGHSVRIVDQDGNPASVGQVGEILVGGPSLMLGYYHDAAATSDVLRDGWLYTGDLGRFDEKGYLYIVGRKKDMIIVHGFNVLPAQVESVLGGHPGVKEVAVAAGQHPRSGECVVAYVVRAPGATVTDSELVEYARSCLAEYKVPREIRFVSDLPRTESGKMARGALRKMSQR